MKKFIVGLSFLSASNVVLAHPGHGLQSAYAGFMHPFTGWDHLLVMLAIGLWAVKIGGKARWQIPTTFLLMMAIGTEIGMLGLQPLGLESVIAASMLAMGLVLLIILPINRLVQFSLTAIFAIFHGIAHGVEIESTNTALVFAGILLATGFLHLIGYGLGSLTTRKSHIIHRAFSCILIATGTYMMLA